jgi:hypothetical protein
MTEEAIPDPHVFNHLDDLRTSVVSLSVAYPVAHDEQLARWQARGGACGNV